MCDCGNFGCLEALASGNAIAKAARARLQAGAESVLRKMCGNAIEGVTAEMVADAAKKKDPVAWDVFSQAAEYLGIGIAALINLLDPDAVIIGGGVAQAGDLLFDIVRKTVSLRALNKIADNAVILPASFGMKAAAMGAVALVLNKVINLENMDIPKSRKARIRGAVVA
ncbi:MAG: ROK family protein [Candidatus Aminicenantales bacterium]